MSKESKMIHWSFNGVDYALGSIFCEEYDGENNNKCVLIKTNVILKKNKGFTRLFSGKYDILEKEPIPEHALIELGAFGAIDPNNWQSKIFEIAKENYGMPSS